MFHVYICPGGWKDEMNILRVPSTKQIRNVAEYFTAHVLSLTCFHACNIAKIKSVKCTHSLKDQCLTEHC